MPDDTDTTHAAQHDGRHRGPIGVGSEAAEGIHDVDMKSAHKRTGLEHRTPGAHVGSEPLKEGDWAHESGYGGKGGGTRTSSETRDSGEQPAVPAPPSVPPPTGKAG